LQLIKLNKPGLGGAGVGAVKYLTQVLFEGRAGIFPFGLKINEKIKKANPTCFEAGREESFLLF
jgi:hypothetical protein